MAKPIRRSSHLADLIQGSGLVGSFGSSASGSVRPTSAPPGALSRKKKERGGVVEEEGERYLTGDEDDTTASFSENFGGDYDYGAGTGKDIGSLRRRAGQRSRGALTDRNKNKLRRPASAQPHSMRTRKDSLDSSLAHTVHAIPGALPSANANANAVSPSLRSKEAWGEDGRDTARRKEIADSGAVKASTSGGGEGEDEQPKASDAIEEELQRLKASTNPKRRYEKLRLLSKIMKRLEVKIHDAEVKLENNVRAIHSKQEDLFRQSEQSSQLTLAQIRAAFSKLEQRCRHMEQDLVQNNKRWSEELKIAKYEYERERQDLQNSLEEERERLQRTLIKHKDQKDLWLKQDFESADQLKLVSRNLEKAEKKGKFLTKELDQTLDHLHSAQHKVLTQDMEMNVLRAEIASWEEKLEKANQTGHQHESKGVEEEDNDGGNKYVGGRLEMGATDNGSGSSGSEKKPKAPKAIEPIAVHLFGGEAQCAKMEQDQKHIVNLEKEIRRLREQLKAIRSEEMARHSVVLSELEDRLQHSEDMGLKARISASHVVKRIKELLEKYYKPPAKGDLNNSRNSSSGKHNSTAKKHMDQIQQELMVIFDKLEDKLGQPDLTLDVDSSSSSSEGGSPPVRTRAKATTAGEISSNELKQKDKGPAAAGGGPGSDSNRGDKTTTYIDGSLMTEREALILECTEYSIQASEETDKVSQLAQLEMQLLDSKVESEKATKEAFENISKIQSLDSELNATKEKLREAQKILSKKNREWVPIGDFVEMNQKAEKAMVTVRGLRDELNRQRTALKFAKQEKEQKDDELKMATTSGFGLHQNVKKLSDNLKSANFQLKHLRGYCDTLKSQREGDIDKVRNENKRECQELQTKLKKTGKQLDQLQVSKYKVESEVRDLKVKVAEYSANQLELKDEAHIAKQDVERILVEKSEAERKLRHVQQDLQVAEANVKYYQSRQQGGQQDRLAQPPSARPTLTLENAFDIFVMGPE